MQMHIPLFPVLMTFLVMLMAIRMVKRTSKAKTVTQRLIPGPPKLPLIGNLHQLAGSALLHRTLRNLARTHGTIMHLQLGQVSTVIISSPEMAKEIMKTHDIIFADRPRLVVATILNYECTDIAFAPYGNYWRQLRKICTLKLLSAARVQSFQSIREDEVMNLIKTIRAHDGVAVNLSEKIFSMTYTITARAAFGKKCRDQEAFISAMSDQVKMISGFFIAEYFPSLKFLDRVSGLRQKAEKIQAETDRILGNNVNDQKEIRARAKDRSEEVEENLVDILLRIQENDEFPLTDNNIKAIVSDMFAAGGETSSTTIEWAMSEIMKDPRVMKEAQAEVRRVFGAIGSVTETGIHELKYLKMVINETLRLHPALPMLLPRECRKDCEVNGFEIPAKTRILVNAWAIGRDPNHWPEPEKFYPERFLNSPVDFMGTDFEFMPFGAGRRMCPGILFAIPDLFLPLAQLLFHFDWKLPNEMKQEDLDMTEAFGVTVRRKDELLLVPTLYHASIVA